MQAYPFFDAYDLPGDKQYLRVALDLADYYLRVQEPEGFWHYDLNPRQKAGIISGGSYNDGAATGGLEMMLVMYHLTRDAKYVARVPRLGQWIFDTQLGQGRVRGWCQQYDLDNRPAAARHFETDTLGQGSAGAMRSRDLVQWEFLPPALLPDRDNGSVLDASGIAALDDQGRPVLFFAKTPAQGSREQWAAVPEDDELLRWRRVDIDLKPGQSGLSFPGTLASVQLPQRALAMYIGQCV